MIGRRSLGVVALALAGAGWVAGGARFLHAVAAPPPFPFPPADAASKFELLREHLPRRGVIGYRTATAPTAFDKLMADDPHRVQRMYVEALLAQHALAPLRLKWRDDLQWTVGNYLDEQAVPPLPEGIGVVEALRPGNGIVLYRRL